jgi:hypothetical protein
MISVRDETQVTELAALLMISHHATIEAAQRGLLSFKIHRGVACWRFGDTRNGCLRRLDGQPLEINGKPVKAEAETRGEAWHRLIGLDNVLANDYREILLTPEGGKDALAALHFADVESRLSDVGVTAALGAAVKLLPEDVEKFRGRRVRIFGDVDPAGQRAASRLGKQLLPVVEEVQIFSLDDLHCESGSLVRDLSDLSRIDYDDFETNRDLWSVTDLDSKGDRVCVLTRKHEFLPSHLPHELPKSREFPMYPVSSSDELENLTKLATYHACSAPNTAKKKRWNLLRDVAAVQKRISRDITSAELMETFDKWHRISQPHLDPKKTRDDYLASFLAEFGKIRVPTGEGEALEKALTRVSNLPPSELPKISDVPESWRWIAALHRELARQSANGTYFLGCRDTAKAHHTLNKDSANKITRALVQLRAIAFMRVGDARPGGKASEFRYLLPL